MHTEIASLSAGTLFECWICCWVELTYCCLHDKVQAAHARTWEQGPIRHESMEHGLSGVREAECRKEYLIVWQSRVHAHEA